MKFKYFLISWLIITISLFSEVTNKKERVISLAPSITEVIFALNAGSDLVGVSTYSNYPKKAQEITKVGSFLDTNIEQIINLEPSVVFLLPSHQKVKNMLQKMEINCVTINHQRIDSILSSFEKIGKILNKQKRATFVQDSLNKVLAKLRSTKLNKKVILCIGRDYGKKINNLFAAGKKTFYDDILELIGAKNALENNSYPQLNLEALLDLDYDLIIDLVASNTNLDQNQELKIWNDFYSKFGLKKKIFIIQESFVSIPGPRVLELALAIKEKILESN